MISVVVCTYNPSDDVLVRVLDAIREQDLDQSAWELIVVDNNSHPPVSTRPCIAARGVRVITESEQGLSKARECGLRNSRGSILVFVDDDNVLAADYLSQVAAIFTDPTIGVVSGAVEPEYEQEPAAWVAHYENMLAVRHLPVDGVYLTDTPPYTDYFAIGAGMAVRREIIESYYRSIAEGSTYIPGRVGTELSSTEDVDLDFYAISQGYRVGVIGSLKLRHVISADRTTVEYISRLAVAATRSAAVVNSKWSAAFGRNVVDIFDIPKQKVLAKYAISSLLRFNPRFRVRYHLNKTLLDELNNSPR